MLFKEAETSCMQHLLQTVLFERIECTQLFHVIDGTVWDNED